MEQNNWKTDKWWISSFNYQNEVRQQFNLPAEIKLHDTTLRDGEQTPGVVFRKNEKIQIAKLLDELGVWRIEAGMPAVSQEDFEALQEICKLGLKADIFGFCRAMREDIDKVVAAGCKGAVIEIASSVPKIHYQFHWKEEDVIAKAVDAVSYAKDKGLKVCFFPFDTTRADINFLRTLLDAMSQKAQFDSLAVVDTAGSCLPTAMKWLVKEVKEMVNVPIEVHTHNDFGMGLATSMAAVEAGAEVVHVCVNGLGERCGNISLDEVALTLRALYGKDCGIKLEKLRQTSQALEEMSGIHIAKNKPVVGDFAFTREIGLGMRVAKETPLLVFPYLDNLVGQKANFVLGKKSGKESIEIKLAELGISATSEQIQSILQDVKQLGANKKRYLFPEEFEEISKRYL